MSKESGLGGALYISGVDVSDEARQWDLASPISPLDVTGLRQLAYQRIWGQRTASLSSMTHFDPLSTGYAALSALPRTDAVVTTPHRELIGSPAACLVVKQIGYDPTRDDKGQVLFKVDTQSNNSFVDWGNLATAGKRTDTTATNGAGIDHGAVPLGPFGLQAYLQLFALTGSNVTVKLQGSSDDGVGDAYSDIVGGSFGALTSAPQGARLITSRTQAVERYVRVVTTGTFTSVTFAVAVVINDVDVEF